jgi:hypothetical protein
MRLRASLRRKPILLAFAVFATGTAVSSLVGWLLRGEFEINHWGIFAALAVVVALQARDHDHSSH